MEPKKFITQIHRRQLARDLGISVMPLYRVLNNEPTVRPATRKRVIDALNKRGYYANQETARKIVVDFSNNHYLLFFGTCKEGMGLIRREQAGHAQTTTRRSLLKSRRN